MLSCVGSVFGAHKGQGRSWVSVLILSIKPYGLADEAVDAPEFIMFHTIFMNILNYGYLVAFPLGECWSCGYMVPSLLQGKKRTRLGLHKNRRYEL